MPASIERCGWGYGDCLHAWITQACEKVESEGDGEAVCMSAQSAHLPYKIRGQSSREMYGEGSVRKLVLQWCLCHPWGILATHHQGVSVWSFAHVWLFKLYIQGFLFVCNVLLSSQMVEIGNYGCLLTIWIGSLLVGKRAASLR